MFLIEFKLYFACVCELLIRWFFFLLYQKKDKMVFCLSYLLFAGLQKKQLILMFCLLL